MKLSLSKKVQLSIIVQDASLSDLELNVVIALASSNSPLLISELITLVRKNNHTYKFVLDKYFCNAVAKLVRQKIVEYR